MKGRDIREKTGVREEKRRREKKVVEASEYCMIVCVLLCKKLVKEKVIKKNSEDGTT